ncbi:MAG: hypothetical protein A2X94_14875 [Bdellovibrionales bacterium GWB1_55_8]|nr:MAG: hypothetical protein A2X94_14875 [Bdellovibrionales bacterium GWB1_55_8]
MVRIINQTQISRKKTVGEKVIYVEISPFEEYERLQIAGALNLPPDKVRERAPRYLPNRAAEIVIYGVTENSPEAWAAARELDAMGYGNIYFYPGGKNEWVKMGYDVESVHYPPPPPNVGLGPDRDVKAA